MTNWLKSLLGFLEQGEAVMLVSVVGKSGSSPRGTDAKMVVTADAIDGTVGGGELEHRAIGDARQCLADNVAGKQDTALLGPDLGQCCGGAVELMFERFGEGDVGALREALAHLDAGRALRRRVRVTGDGKVEQSFELAAPCLQSEKGVREVSVAPGEFIEEVICDDRQPLWLFGAGHVGRAIVNAMTGLPFVVTWIDSRPEIFADGAPAGVAINAPSAPETAVKEAPAGTWYLVMTHSHAFDEAICETILRRRDAAYLGLIGSRTKRARFEHRMGARGVGEAVLAEMHCPIGLPGIAGKAPAVIAASVVADLLMRLENADNDQQSMETGLGNEPGRSRTYAQSN